MSNRIEMCKKIVELESSIEENLSKLNEFDNNENSTKNDKLNERFLENRREALKDELHQLELEFLDTTWSDTLQKSQVKNIDSDRKFK